MSGTMSVRGAALLAMASQMGAFIIQFAASVILARWFIDPEELGLFTIAFSFVSLLVALSESIDTLVSVGVVAATTISPGRRATATRAMAIAVALTRDAKG